MKKIIALIISIVMLFTMVACSNNQETVNSADIKFDKEK